MRMRDRKKQRQFEMVPWRHKYHSKLFLCFFFAHELSEEKRFYFAIQFSIEISLCSTSGRLVMITNRWIDEKLQTSPIAREHTQFSVQFYIYFSNEKYSICLFSLYEYLSNFLKSRKTTSDTHLLLEIEVYFLSLRSNVPFFHSLNNVYSDVKSPPHKIYIIHT